MFDAISSIGMFEHVGRARIGDYFDVIRRCSRPQGRLLNHAISTAGGARLRSAARSCTATCSPTAS